MDLGRGGIIDWSIFVLVGGETLSKKKISFVLGFLGFFIFGFGFLF